jgi:hypothetical protein
MVKQKKMQLKEAAVHTASSPSSRNAKAALEKVAARFGKTIIVVNDND